MSNRVKSLMVLNGVQQVDICRKLHVTPATVSLIVSGKKTSARVRLAIAKALGMKIEELWPENSPQPSLTSREGARKKAA